MFKPGSQYRLLVLIIGWLLFVAPVQMRAQDGDDEPVELPPRTAWLVLHGDKLYYIGEQTEFALQRNRVTEVYSRNTAAEWFSEKNLFLQWKNDRMAARPKQFHSSARTSLQTTKQAHGWMTT